MSQQFVNVLENHVGHDTAIPTPPPSSTDLQLTVVVVTPSNFANIRRTIRHLQAQTIVEQIELILVASSTEAIADGGDADLAGFGRQQTLTIGPITNVDRAAAAGVFHATTPIVALIEDHAFPAPGWAAAMVAAHQGEWAAVGSTMENANPQSLLSWINLLIAYGPWTEPATDGEVATLPGHNISYKREYLLAYGDTLGAALERGGELPNALRKKGHRFYLAAAAKLSHLNPSRLTSTADLRFSAGRLYGATRAADEGWSWLKRLLYIVSGPLIPLVRIRRFRQELFANHKRAHLRPRIWPALLLGLIFDAAGQMVGYGWGPGKTAEKLAVFEMDRPQHLTPQDRVMLQTTPMAAEVATGD